MDKRTAAKGVAALVLVALVAPFVIYAVPATVGADHSFVVLSGSMSPSIETGDVVIVRETDPATISEGDVITYQRTDEESPTTHRVVGVEQGADQLAFETKGDANEDPDPGTVPASNVLGVVVFTIPLIGSVIQFTNTTLGFVLLVALPLGALALSEVWELGKKHRTGTDANSRESVQAEGDDGTSAADPPMLSLHPTDLAVTTTLLALLVPYMAFVAFQLRTPVTFSLVFASFFTALATGAVLLLERDSQDEQSKSASGGGAVTINPADLKMTSILLVLVTPYAGYVAIQLQTPLAFSVAFTSLFTALATGWLLLSERLPRENRSQRNADGETDPADDTPPEPAPDGGTVEEVE